MQKEDVIEHAEVDKEDEIEQVDDVVSSNETAKQVTNKLHDETTPVEKRNYVSYFMTLEERRDAGLLLKYKSVKPEPLITKVVGALATLFVNNKVHLYLPWWSDEKKHNPIDFYELRFSSNGVGQRKFANPYDPILIRREKHNTIVAVVYEGYIFRRDATPMLLELLEEMANDPAEFFERVGKRWGRCLCCKKEITADKSIERAIGPVCYKRIKKVVTFITRVKDEIEIETSRGTVALAPTARSLNPIEYDGVVALSNMYLDALKCGFEFDPGFGALLMPKETGDHRYCGELTEVKRVKYEQPYCRRVGRGRKECLLFQITEETPHTIAVLAQLDARWDREEEIWTVLKENKQKLGDYFRIKWRNAKQRQPIAVSANSATITSTTTNTNNAQKIQLQYVGDHIELGGATYPYRILIRGVGGEWDKDRKIWVVPISSKDKVEELVRKINENN